MYIVLGSKVSKLSVTQCGNCVLSIINGQKASSFLCGAFDQGKKGEEPLQLGIQP